MSRQAIIIGAGPAGLTAALELLRRTDVKPIIVEASQEIGGISRTIEYKGNRMDIGGHRFFSKSDRVMQWWMEIMPLVTETEDLSESVEVTYRGERKTVQVPASSPEHPPLRGMGPLTTIESETEETDAEGKEDTDRHGHTRTLTVQAVPVRDTNRVMLVRPRQSRIYYLRKFFEYPIKLSANTLRNLGVMRVWRVALSYAWAHFKPIRPESSLQDFLINRFGRELYLTFFRSYTEKVWGVPCDQISAEWGAQRIKGLSLVTAVRHFVRKGLQGGTGSQRNLQRETDVAQKQTDTSLIERFLYPKYGPGQLWEIVAEQITEQGGRLEFGWTVDRILTESDEGGELRVIALEAVNRNGERQLFEGETFLSTMPIKELTRALHAGGACIPSDIQEISEGLQYRDFITVGVLAKSLDVRSPKGGLIEDTWIYIQEPDVLLGRLQIFNNWSPYMVSNSEQVWLGLEYFCYDSDPLWGMPDTELKQFAINELEKLGILRATEVLDTHVVRVPKTYPAYFGTYDRFAQLRDWLDHIENLFLVGRNGMHKYNNQDHSMLTAMTVVDGIARGHVDKSAVWAINTEQDYHEEKRRT